MIEITIHGRGGQGGVTLAKLIATAYFLRGKHVQAFGVYAAERSGAPLQAFVRIDDAEITNHNQVRRPDHIIVLDPTLLHARIATALKPGGWVVINTERSARECCELLPGLRMACVDATGIAVSQGLGSKAVPIVNTTMLGAVARVFDLAQDDVTAALAEVKFGGANVVAALQAFERVEFAESPARSEAPDGAPTLTPPGTSRIAGLLDEEVGGPPLIRTGAWANRRPHRRRLTPPCNHGCPAGNDVQGFVAAIGKGDIDHALEILLETSPLPGVCGRVCPAPCMDACNRGQFDESLNIRELERHAADHGRRPAPLHITRFGRVCVIGAGPAGLSAAYHAARLGYAVSLIDALEQPGGVLRNGIPEYRLPHEALDRDIQHVLSHGVKFHGGRRVDRAALLALTHEYDAIFLATGLQLPHHIDLGPGAAHLVMDGVAFLDRAHHRHESLDGQQVIVIGGGNTAIDAARTARRLGAVSVRIVYRRTRAEMPAIAEEIDEALEEGVELCELLAPQRLRTGGHHARLICAPMMLGPPGADGRRRPVPRDGPASMVELMCDRVILALGQGPDISILPEGSEVVHEGRALGLTAAPVFAGGDFATNEGTVAAAIGSGRRAAWHIHRTLSGEDCFAHDEAAVAGPDAVTTHFFSYQPRQHGHMVAAHDRTTSFTEVRTGFRDEPGGQPAVLEAQRCFSCGVCNGCDRCVTHCPEGILRRDGDGYVFDYDYCKGCGLCASQCPRGVVYMAQL